MTIKDDRCTRRLVLHNRNQTPCKTSKEFETVNISSIFMNRVFVFFIQKLAIKSLESLKCQGPTRFFNVTDTKKDCYLTCWSFDIKPRLCWSFEILKAVIENPLKLYLFDHLWRSNNILVRANSHLRSRQTYLEKKIF